VIDTVPGEPGCGPLRRLPLVARNSGVLPRLLRSAEDVHAAELSVTTPGAVVNMPVTGGRGGAR